MLPLCVIVIPKRVNIPTGVTPSYMGVRLCLPFWMPDQEYTKPNSSHSLSPVFLTDQWPLEHWRRKSYKSVAAIVTDEYWWGVKALLLWTAQNPGPALQELMTCGWWVLLHMQRDEDIVLCFDVQHSQSLPETDSSHPRQRGTCFSFYFISWK